MTRGAARTICSKCSGKVIVISTYHRKEGPILITRRRKCTKCDHRFTTYEVTADMLADMLVFHRQAGKLEALLEKIETEAKK